MLSFNFGSGAAISGESLDPPFVTQAPIWKFKNSFRKVSESGNQSRIADIVAPLAKRTTIKYSIDRIANVYNTLGDALVPVSNQSLNTAGQTLFVELKTVATSTPTAPALPFDVPMVCRIEIRIPTFADITDADVETLVLHTVAALRSETDGTMNVISEKMRGALTPAGI